MLCTLACMPYETEIDDDADDAFERQLHLDSLDRVEIIMWLEDAFAIDIPDDDSAKIRTVTHIVDYLMEKGCYSHVE